MFSQKSTFTAISNFLVWYCESIQWLNYLEYPNERKGSSFFFSFFSTFEWCVYVSFGLWRKYKWFAPFWVSFFPFPFHAQHIHGILVLLYCIELNWVHHLTKGYNTVKCFKHFFFLWLQYSWYQTSNTLEFDSPWINCLFFFLPTTITQTIYNWWCYKNQLLRHIIES